LANFNLQKEIAAAQANDNEKLESKMATVVELDAEILRTVQEIARDIGGIRQVMKEVLEVSLSTLDYGVTRQNIILQCKALLDEISLPKRQEEFVRRTTVAITIATKGRTSVKNITVAMIASTKYAIEIQSVTYDEEDDYIGRGGFGMVFKARWDGTASIFQLLLVWVC
jgi:hypothetical protein